MTVTLDVNAPVAESSTRRALADISLSVAKCKKIVVVTGAGISCSCGIPDFRSSDGLYALVKEQYPDVVMKGRDLFDASLFRDQTSTSVFYSFISQLKRSIDSASPAPTHEFIKRLDNRHKLLRSYTQNIDGLEEKAGLICSSTQGTDLNIKGKSKLWADEVRNIQLHGDIRRVRCTFCSVDLPCTEEHIRMFEKGVPPDCPECTSRSEARIARSARALKVGSLRPAIVLYDEAHPMGDDIGKIQSQDIARKPDLLIVMGTSLKVHGLKKLVKEFAKAVHATAPSPTGSPKRAKRWQGKVVFVNKTPPGSEWSDVIDYHIMGEIDQWIEKVTEDWRRIRPSDWEIQQTLDDDGNFKIAKNKGKSKQKPPGAENASPSGGIPFPSIIIKPGLSAPSSPSKRRQSISHYCDLDSSPRKRRDVAKTYDKASKCLLFVDATNSIPQMEDGFTTDPFGSPFKHPGRRPRTRTMSTEMDIKRPRANSTTLRKKRVEIAVKS